MRLTHISSETVQNKFRSEMLLLCSNCACKAHLLLSEMRKKSSQPAPTMEIKPPSPLEPPSASWRSPPSSARSPNAWTFLKRRLSDAVIGGSSADATAWTDKDSLPDSFFDLNCKDAKGADFPLAGLRGKPLIVVNVASA